MSSGSRLFELVLLRQWVGIYSECSVIVVTLLATSGAVKFKYVVVVCVPVFHY